MIAVICVALVVLPAAAAKLAWSAGAAIATRSRFEELSGAHVADVRRRPPRWLVAQASRAGVPVASLEQGWPIALVVALAVAVVSTMLFGVPGLIAACLLAVAGPSIAAKRRAVVLQRRKRQALPELLEDVARGLRSGASLRQALALSRDRADVLLRPELVLLCDTVSNGGSLEVALETWSERQPSEGLRLAVTALCLGIDAGAAHGRALDDVAAGLRDETAIERELAALVSQARASASVMAVAPLAFAAFTVTADARTAHFLFGTTAGLTCLAAGLALDACAAWWMVRITGAERCEP